MKYIFVGLYFYRYKINGMSLLRILEICINILHFFNSYEIIVGVYRIMRYTFVKIYIELYLFIYIHIMYLIHILLV